MKILSNQTRAFDTPSEAWAWAKSIISAYGSDVIDEDGKNTREVQNLQVTVLKPLYCWPIIGSEWSSEGALHEYAKKEILSPIIPEGFRYSYGERLFAYPWFDNGERMIKLDQIRNIIYRLRAAKTTRRAVAVTLHPEYDAQEDSIPCLQLIDFLFRGGKLNLTAYFRSHDIERAYPCNLYGLNKLLEYVAREAGMEPGSITTISASAHIYVE